MSNAKILKSNGCVPLLPMLGKSRKGNSTFAWTWPVEQTNKQNSLPFVSLRFCFRGMTETKQLTVLFCFVLFCSLVRTVSTPNHLSLAKEMTKMGQFWDKIAQKPQIISISISILTSDESIHDIIISIQANIHCRYFALYRVDTLKTTRLCLCIKRQVLLLQSKTASRCLQWRKAALVLWQMLE